MLGPLSWEVKEIRGPGSRDPEAAEKLVGDVVRLRLYVLRVATSFCQILLLP